MNITFIINRNFLYHFQSHLIEELIEKYSDVKIQIKVDEQNQNKDDFAQEKLLRKIDRRFSNFFKNPLTEINLDQLREKYSNIIVNKGLQANEFQSDWTIYLYPNPKPNRNFLEKANNLLKLDLDEKYWFQSSISNQDYTRIEIFRFEQATETWNSYRSMSFATQKGIYNNRAKALYYYSLLIGQSVVTAKTDNIASNIQQLNLTKGISAISIIGYYLSLMRVIVSRKLQRKKLNWKIAIKRNDQLQFINQPKCSFWADPFPVLKEDKLFLFIEEYNYDTNLGEIALLELDEQLNVKDKSTLIKENFHLSFPNVFRIGQEYYMMPETSDHNKLLIYKSNDFPNHWTLCSELMTGIKLVDAVWIFHEGLYWLFANKIHTFETDNNECLYLYYSTDLFSNNWHAHPQNPIVVNQAQARNAGQIYMEDNKLYRPSQNCKKSYGAAIVIHEITELTTEKYSEIIIRTIQPEKQYHGLHTYNKLNDLVVLDYLKQE